MSAIQFAFLVTFLILSTATLTTFVLLKRDPANKTLNNVRVIVRSWWMILGVLLCGLALGKYGITALFYILTLFAYREFMRVSRLQDLKKTILVILFIVLTLQYLALLSEAERFFFALIPLMAIWIIPAIVVFTASIERLPQILATGFCLLLLGYYLSHVPAIVMMLPKSKVDPNFPVIAIVFLVLMTEGNDVFQFLSGKLFGKRKIVPVISPNKTEAGFIGGLVMTTMLSVLVARNFLELSYSQAAILGSVISITGMCGDLLFSAAKRYLEVKDFSHLIPGHGGILDRIDSLILTAPVFFHLLLYFQS